MTRRIPTNDVPTCAARPTVCPIALTPRLGNDRAVSAEFKPEQTGERPPPPPRSWGIALRVLQLAFLVFATFTVVESGSVWRTWVAAALCVVLLSVLLWEYARKRRA